MSEYVLAKVGRSDCFLFLVEGWYTGIVVGRCVNEVGVKVLGGIS